MNYLLVALGAAVGAPLRYLTDRFIQSRHQTLFPWGTLTANLVGSLILGGVAGAALGATDPLYLLIGTGFCGALTTYSTFAYEAWRLAERRERLLALANVAGSIAAGLGAASLGYLVVDGLR